MITNNYLVDFKDCFVNEIISVKNYYKKKKKGRAYNLFYQGMDSSNEILLKIYC